MPQTVLVVEDHPDTRALYSLSLASEGFEVVEAEHGAAALEWLMNHHADAIVTDLAMPGVDGIELCRRIRATAGGGDVPILAVSGQPAPLTRREVEAAGACALFEKPLAPEALGRAVRALLAEGPRCWRCWETANGFRWVRIGGVQGLMRHEPIDPKD